MITGLVETVGTLRRVHRASGSMSLGIVPDSKEFDVGPGHSVCVDGVCLTLEKVSDKMLFFTAVHETLSRTTLADARTGDRVNLERSVRPSDRLGGHFVLGHIDGVGRILRDRKDGDSIVRTVWVPPELRMFMAPKGSVALDGVSLTIARTNSESIDVALIPFSLNATTMHALGTGDSLNIEADVLARYILHMMQGGVHPLPSHTATPASKDDSLLDKLERAGF
jgi:riboflavin synthase